MYIILYVWVHKNETNLKCIELPHYRVNKMKNAYPCMLIAMTWTVSIQYNSTYIIRWNKNGFV